jgi:hypothetical protein
MRSVVVAAPPAFASIVCALLTRRRRALLPMTPMGEALSLGRDLPKAAGHRQVRLSSFAIAMTLLATDRRLQGEISSRSPRRQVPWGCAVWWEWMGPASVAMSTGRRNRKSKNTISAPKTPAPKAAARSGI